jgi:ABC-type branched-subunit amino acid transport system permease subunit
VPYNQVAQCVIENSQKVDWLGILKLPYQGASSCQSSAYWIAVQVGSVIISLSGAVAVTLLSPKLKKLWNACWGKRPKNESHKDIWVLPDEYMLKASELLASVGGDLLAIFLSIIVMRQSGVYIFGITIIFQYFLTACQVSVCSWQLKTN